MLLVQTQPEPGPHEDDQRRPHRSSVTGLAPLATLPHLPAGRATDDDALAAALLQAIGSAALDRLLTLATGSPTGSPTRG